MKDRSAKFLTPPRVVALLWIVLMAFFYTRGLGAVMRESDQAALLEGALALARDWQPVGADFYSYDKQWLSYWLLSVPVKIGLSGGSDFDLESLVFLGNVTALVVGLSGVGLAYLYGAGKSWGSALAGGVLLLVPTWMFSAPLLSSNVLSIGFLGFWVVAADALGGRWRVVFSAIFAFMAVACRADAVLVFPALALAWWGVGRSWNGILGAGTLWSAALGAVAALAVGVLLKGEVGEPYAAFFQAKTFAAYLVFGLGGAIFFYLGMAWLVLLDFWSGKNKAAALRSLVWLGLLLLPLLFYGRLLFTPRHLLTSFAVLALSACLAGARPWWRDFVFGRGRWIFGLACAGLLIPVFCGIQLQSLSSGKLVFSGEATRYPSADGLWPMGSYFGFMEDLGASATRPIDHNQRIWGAWQRLMPEESWQGKRLFFRTIGLASYGSLWAAWHGLESMKDEEAEKSEGAVILGDDRSLIKQAISVNGDISDGADGENAEIARVLAVFQMGRILQFDPPSGVNDARDLLATTTFLREKYGGDAFLLTTYAEKRQLTGDARFRWAVVKRGENLASEGATAIKADLWFEELPGDAVKLRDDKFLFLVRSELPRYFSLSLFEKR